MNLNATVGYGMAAVAYIAERHEQGPVLAKEISEEHSIPVEYLLKILQQLVRAGILRSKRGTRGGFSLAKPPKNVTLLEIIEAVNGPFRNRLDIVEQTGGAASSIKMEQACDGALEKAKTVLRRAKLSGMIA